MMTMRFSGAFALFLCMGVTSAQAALIKPTELLRDPSSEDWMLLNRFDGTLTREQFEERLLKVFDPFGGISPFLNVTDREVTVFASSAYWIAIGKDRVCQRGWGLSCLSRWISPAASLSSGAD